MGSMAYAVLPIMLLKLLFFALLFLFPEEKKAAKVNLTYPVNLCYTASRSE